jgi:hypothetical protein
LSDRQRELLAAVAALGGRGSRRDISAVLGRTAQAISWIVDDLTKSGDLLSPRRGVLELAVPAFAGLILESYPEATLESAVEVVAPEEMLARAGVLRRGTRREVEA